MTSARLEQMSVHIAGRWTKLFRLLTVALILTSPLTALAWTAKVVGVSDGDTIRVMHNGREEKIRLFGVDCPEKDQDFGNKAKRFTSDMVFGKTVEVEQVDRDQYGRTVAWVTVDGRSLNKELLRAGLAWWYRSHARKDAELAQLENEARQNRLGLWSHRDPVPPWKFRRDNRDKHDGDSFLQKFLRRFGVR